MGSMVFIQRRYSDSERKKNSKRPNRKVLLNMTFTKGVLTSTFKQRKKQQLIL